MLFGTDLGTFQLFKDQNYLFFYNNFAMMAVVRKHAMKLDLLLMLLARCMKRREDLCNQAEQKTLLNMIAVFDISGICLIFQQANSKSLHGFQ